MAHRYGSFSDAPVTTANMRCQANLKCPQGLTVSGDLVIPPGNVYVNFKIKDDPPQEGAPVGGGGGHTILLCSMARTDMPRLPYFLVFA